MAAVPLWKQGVGGGGGGSNGSPQPPPFEQASAFPMKYGEANLRTGSHSQS